MTIQMWKEEQEALAAGDMADLVEYKAMQTARYLCNALRRDTIAFPIRGGNIQAWKANKEARGSLEDWRDYSISVKVP